MILLVFYSIGLFPLSPCLPPHPCRARPAPSPGFWGLWCALAHLPVPGPAGSARKPKKHDQYRPGPPAPVSSSGGPVVERVIAALRRGASLSSPSLRPPVRLLGFCQVPGCLRPLPAPPGFVRPGFALPPPGRPASHKGASVVQRFVRPPDVVLGWSTEVPPLCAVPPCALLLCPSVQRWHLVAVLVARRQLREVSGANLLVSHIFRRDPWDLTHGF